MKKRLYRYPQRGMLMGVCQGIGEYFNVSADLVRLVFILFLASNIFIYFILALIMPKGE
jgi:phage shock protein C